jgi:hypothetical protein
MRKAFLSVLLVSVLLTSITVQGQLLVFKGTATDAYTGENHSLRIASRLIVVIDYGTGTFGRLEHSTISGTKRYTSGTFTNAHLVHVAGPLAKPYTAVAHIPNACDQEDHPNHEGVYFAGPDANLTVNPGITVSFPKTLTSAGSGLFYATGSGNPVISQGSMLAVFNTKETSARNEAGDTLESAMAGYIAYVEGLGYSH